MRWTYDRVSEFYERARRRACCYKCGAKGLVEVPGGHPVRRWGKTNLGRVKARIREVGWQCRACSRGTAATTGKTPTARQRVDALRKEIRPFKDRNSEEMRVRRVERIRRMGEEWNRGWESTATTTGSWMDPDELDRKKAEIQELSSSNK